MLLQIGQAVLAIYKQKGISNKSIDECDIPTLSAICWKVKLQN